MGRFTGVIDQPVTTVTIDCSSGPVEALLSQPSVTGVTTIAAGSDGQSLPQATITVASTASFASAGTIFVQSTLNGVVSIVPIAYTGKTGTTFTGCTGGGLGVINTGNAVSGAHGVAWAGVDRWLTPDGNPPVLATAANAVDHLFFELVGGLTYGRHKSGRGIPGGRGPVGPVGMQNQGTYNPATPYALNDVVAYLGSSYVCIQAGTGHAPATTGTAFWDLMALAGASGPTGPSGPTGSTGPTGATVPPNDPGTPGTSLDLPGVAAQAVAYSKISNYIYYSDATLGYLGNAAGGLGLTGVSLAANFLYRHGAQASTNPSLPGANTLARWTADPNADLSVAGYEWQRQIVNSNFVARAHSFGLNNLYLGFYARNQYNIHTMFWDWFDDVDWLDPLTTEIHNLAGAAKMMGFNGLTIDCEGLTVGNPPGVPSFDWNVYGGGHGGEAPVRAKIKARGAQLMQAMLDVFPGIELNLYHTISSWEDIKQHKVNGAPIDAVPVNSGLVNFLDGLTSVPGYSRIRLIDATFYYGPQVAGAVGATAMKIDANAMLAYCSQNFSNWAYANPRFSITPFMWLGPSVGDGSVYTATSGLPVSGAGYTDLSLVADARKYGMTGKIFWYDSNGPIPPSHAAYSNYSTPNSHYSAANFEPVFQSITPGVVDTSDPTLGSIVVTRDNATTVHATGTATDNLGVRAIRWFCGPSAGAAVHAFVPEQTRVDGGVTVADYTLAEGSFTFHHTWVANGIPATAGQTITFAVEDIKGRVATYTRTAPA